MSKVFWGFTLLVLLTTTEYRVDLGFLSVAIVEPFALVYAAFILFPKLLRRETLVWRDPFFLLFALITAWATLIRPFAPDWRHGLSDIRDWLIPTFVLFALINIPRPAGRAFHSAFVAVVLLVSAIGIYQYVTDSFRPFIHEGTIFKPNFLGGAPGSFAVGFFNAPNGLGLFLAAGVPFCFAWLRISAQRYGWLRYGLLLVPLSALYLTFSRTSLLVLGILVLFLFLHYMVPSTRNFGFLMIFLIMGGFMIFGLALEFLPHDTLRTFWWRIALWEIAIITLLNNPFIWLFGNGIDQFIPLSFYPQPHNQTIFMLLEYGVMGVFVFVGIVAWIVFSGLRARASGYFEQYPALAPLWIGICGQFLITLTESSWLGVNGRLLLVCMIAVYHTLLIEVTPDLVKLPSLRLPSVRFFRTAIARESHS